MLLEEFMETDIYKDAGCIGYVGADGMEINEDEEENTWGIQLKGIVYGGQLICYE